MNIPADLKYSKSDEWVKVEGSAATTGVTDYAQGQLSDIVYVELPALGAAIKQGQPWGSVESVKAAADVNLPLSGTVTAVNEALKDKPETVNSDPYGAGWMVKFTLTNPGELGGLMDAAAYTKYCDERKS
jgi:glycine cleavage system H protein